MAEEENVFDDSVDYTKKGETYARDNYKAWAMSKTQDEIFQMLAHNNVGSELKLKNWEKETLVDMLATVRCGKDKDED